ncbi:hypothetical protein BDF21DRAFT_242228 [Thamnidium elegans]|nr:hypothetical protein BDF21DRAFT_242228 [Thamnidium elegans]
MNKENEDNYLKSLENRAFQESIFSNLTTANFLEQVNKKKAVASNSATHSSSGSLPISTEESTNQTNKRIEEIEQYVGKDSIKINNNDLSVGTIIKRAAMMKHINYKLLTPSDIALVDCGFNCILDLTHGSLTNQHLLFSKEDWNRIKALFSTSPTNNDLIESRPTLRKIDRIFKNPRDTEECYWKSKNCQRKASKFNEKTGYELISVIIDKMIKHNSIFTLSKPTPSEADVMIKIWADIFEVLFYNTGIYVRWGEKRLATDDNDATIFKLDAKLVLLYDAAEYPVCAVEFASYAGSKKIKTDRSKLLVEAKVICDKVMELNINEENAALLNIVNIQIMGKFWLYSLHFIT